ncbi:SDR family NAD(P)-dependent oxidoreductase [Bradyrhizobium sp. TM239]|uniref:SDR family NAD(P)-dependent oxidoreductase n=1 Tax=Bradyrhizobium sp. TM239 TaxID=2599802 RepID=UPI0027D6A2A3|nr:SDR family oxidoreductase UcpA [Bradyrhizobium sp. TM239]
MTGKLAHKTAILTGAGSGIGAAIARAFAQEGATLVLNDIDQDSLIRLKADLPDRDHRLVVGDVSVAATASALAREADAVAQRADILVNNAGILHCRDITETQEDEFDRVVAVNIKSMYQVCRAVLPMMVARGEGAIVNVGSLAGMVGMEFGGESTWLYSTTKAAIFQFTRSLASRYGKDGIRVNTLAPGATRTNQLRQLHPNISAEAEDQMWRDTGGRLTLLGRVADPGEIARVALFLASSDASYITGQHILADGGYAVR